MYEVGGRIRKFKGVRGTGVHNEGLCGFGGHNERTKGIGVYKRVEGLKGVQ